VLTAQPTGATPLDEDDIEGLIPTHITTRSELDAWEQQNIFDAVQWAFSGRKRDVLSMEALQDLHRRMFSQTWRWAGAFRQKDTNMGAPWPYIGTRLVELVDDVRYWTVEGTYVWDEAGARFHHRLVSIHPFRNGNGRQARLAADLFVVAMELPRFTWGRVDLVRESTTRARYIQALQAADGGDYGPLLNFVRS
jgi:Fic-DOC domain mobile mystery protein B